MNSGQRCFNLQTRKNSTCTTSLHPKSETRSPSAALDNRHRGGVIQVIWGRENGCGDSLLVMNARDGRRLATLVVVAIAFGVGDSMLKGNGGGIRSALGNTSAPWLLLPFVGGAFVGRGRMAVGAAVGLALSLVALCSFYVANSFVLRLGPHPWTADMRLAFDGGKRFFVLAILSGPIFGWLGSGGRGPSQSWSRSGWRSSSSSNRLPLWRRRAAALRLSGWGKWP